MNPITYSVISDNRIISYKLNNFPTKYECNLQKFFFRRFGD